jgi:hypothetical protein
MIDKSTTEFLEGGLAIHLGTRNARLEPNGCRVTAVRVENQGREVVAFVPAAAAPAVFEDLHENGQAALSFARPMDDRAMQVKGVFVDIRDGEPAEEAFVMAQWQGFLRQLEIVGIPGRATATWKLWPCRAVRIRVTALFSSTPGPDAGAVLT